MCQVDVSYLRACSKIWLISHMVSPWSRKSWRLFNVRLRMASRGGAGTTWFAGALYRTCGNVCVERTNVPRSAGPVKRLLKLKQKLLILFYFISFLFSFYGCVDTYNFHTEPFPPEILEGSVLLALIISVHLTASWSSINRSLYWFRSISTLAISTRVNRFLWDRGTSSSSSLFVALAAASASSLTFFNSSSRATIRCRNRSRACCKPRTSSRNISCSLEC